MTVTDRPIGSVVHLGSGEPCPRCLALWDDGVLRAEMVMPLSPVAALNPLARDGSGKCCGDCGAADGLIGAAPSFEAARIATGSHRQEQLRLPGNFYGLVQMGRMRPCQDGDLGLHTAWLKEQQITDLGGEGYL